MDFLEIIEGKGEKANKLTCKWQIKITFLYVYGNKKASIIVFEAFGI